MMAIRDRCPIEELPAFLDQHGLAVQAVFWPEDGQPENLSKLGYRRFEWNNGVILEYWKPLHEDDNFNLRLGVRFNEHPWHPVAVYIFLPSSAYQMTWLKAVDQVEQLYQLLRNPRH